MTADTPQDAPQPLSKEYLSELERLVDDFLTAADLCGDVEHEEFADRIMQRDRARRALIAGLRPENVLALIAEIRSLRERVAVAEEAVGRIAHLLARWRILRKKSEIQSLHEKPEVLRLADALLLAAMMGARKSLGLPPAAPDAGEPGAEEVQS